MSLKDRSVGYFYDEELSAFFSPLINVHPGT